MCTKNRPGIVSFKARHITPILKNIKLNKTIYANRYIY